MDNINDFILDSEDEDTPESGEITVKTPNNELLGLLCSVETEAQKW